MYTMANKGEQDPFLKDLLRVVWRRAWVIAVVAAVFAGAAVGLSLVQTPQYEASASLLVGQKSDPDRVTSLGSDIMGLQQATQTVAVAVDSAPVAQAVIGRLDLRTDPEVLLTRLSVQQIESSQFVEITFTYSDPETAQEVVNTVGDVGAERISESSAGASGIKASVWEYAKVPEFPFEPNPLRNALLALGLGLMFGVGLTFLLEYLDDGWRSTEEVEQVLGVPSFGNVPEFDVAKIRKIRSA